MNQNLNNQLLDSVANKLNQLITKYKDLQQQNREKEQLVVELTQQLQKLKDKPVVDNSEQLSSLQQQVTQLTSEISLKDTLLNDNKLTLNRINGDNSWLQTQLDQAQQLLSEEATSEAKYTDLNNKITAQNYELDLLKNELKVKKTELDLALKTIDKYDFNFNEIDRLCNKNLELQKQYEEVVKQQNCKAEDPNLTPDYTASLEYQLNCSNELNKKYKREISELKIEISSLEEKLEQGTLIYISLDNTLAQVNQNNSELLQEIERLKKTKNQ